MDNAVNLIAQLPPPETAVNYNTLYGRFNSHLFSFNMKAIALALLFSLASLTVLAIVEAVEKLQPLVRTLLTLLAIAVYGLVLVLQPEPVLAAGWVGLVAVSFAGQAFGSKLIPNAPGLITFFITASILDLTSVAAGPTKILLDAADGGETVLVHYLALLLPWQGTQIPALGVGDLFGLAVLFSSLRGQGFSRRGAFTFGLLGLLAALAVALAWGGVAGYPFLGVAAIAALLFKNWQNE